MRSARHASGKGGEPTFAAVLTKAGYAQKQSLQSSPKPPKPAARSDGVRCAEEVEAVTMPKRRATVAKSKWLEGR